MKKVIDELNFDTYSVVFWDDGDIEFEDNDRSDEGHYFCIDKEELKAIYNKAFHTDK